MAKYELAFLKIIGVHKGILYLPIQRNISIQI